MVVLRQRDRVGVFDGLQCKEDVVVEGMAQVVRGN